MKNQNKKGFTLVELVIVIAVIAILAGVLIGTFATVISRANQSKAVQEWKAAVDEAYVEYVAEYHDVPTAFKVEGKTIQFGNEKTYADDRFVTGFTKLAAGYIELDKDQKVYFNWTGTGSGSTYAVATTSEGDKLTTAATTKTYEEAMTAAAQTAFGTSRALTNGSGSTGFVVLSGKYAFVVAGTTWGSQNVYDAFDLDLENNKLTVNSTIYNLVTAETFTSAVGPCAKKVETGIYEIKPGT